MFLEDVELEIHHYSSKSMDLDNIVKVLIDSLCLREHSALNFLYELPRHQRYSIGPLLKNDKQVKKIEAHKHVSDIYAKHDQITILIRKTMPCLSESNYISKPPAKCELLKKYIEVCRKKAEIQARRYKGVNHIKPDDTLNYENMTAEKVALELISYDKYVSES
jgi:hypothetical protein